MLSKPPAMLAFSDLESLVVNQATESRTLEFKQVAIGPTDNDKREFLADVSAFANTLGGDIVFGVEETGGEATGLKPLQLADPDAEVLRLNNILQTGLEPRLPSVEVQWVPAPTGGGAIVVRTQKSWAAPHRVIFKNHSKFYGRNSAGKFELDVAQLRSAFVASEELVERVRSFRRERALLIEAGEGAVPITPGATLVFHVVPVSAFSNPITIHFDDRTPILAPLGARGANTLPTFEGQATYSGREHRDGPVRAYTLLFRNGILEATAHVGFVDEKGAKYLYASSVEGTLYEDVQQLFQTLQRIGVEPPFYVSLTIIGVRDHKLAIPSGRFIDRQSAILNRDVLNFPEILTSDAVPSYETILRPSFDLLWRAFGYTRSFSFDAQGRYTGGR